MPSLYLIRHGQSEMNQRYPLICGRSNESPMTPLGERQARALGAYLRQSRVSFDEVYTSPAIRTKQTARIVCERIGFPLERIVENDMVQELSQGEWVGRDRTTVYTPELQRVIDADNLNFKAPGGESQREVEERMTRWAERTVIDRHAHDRTSIALFGHGMAIKCFLRGILQWHPSYTWRIEFPNTSVSRMEYGPKGWYPRTINSSGHLLLLRQTPPDAYDTPDEKKPIDL